MITLADTAAKYYNPEIKGYIWPDSCGQPCFYCGSITAWTVVVPKAESIAGRLKTRCCSEKCLESYKAEKVIDLTKEPL